MRINDIIYLLLAFVAGILLGIIFFGGLWLTIRKGLSSRHAPVLFMGSLFLRLIIVLAGFYYFSRGSAVPLISCTIGFIVARVGMHRQLKKVKKEL